MPVQFKFRGEKAFRSLLNVTTPCTLLRVKNAIYEQARISDSTTDLALEDSSTGEALDPKVLLVQDSLVQVIVRRTPLQNQGGAPASSSLSLVGAPQPVLATDVQEEDLAIDRIIEQHDVAGSIVPASSSNALLRYSRSYRLAVGSRQRQRDGYDIGSDLDDDDALQEEAREPPPVNYTCHRCGQVGGKPESHWIWECPTNEDPDHMKKVRTAKGIPRDFLRKVATVEEGQEQSAGGVTFTLPGHSGHYIVSHEATYEDKKLRVGDTVQEKVITAFTDGAKKVEESLKCPLCHQLFRQAILAPCCGATFCSDCVVDRLAHSSVENSSCPGCGKEVYAHQLIANEDIRKQVEQISRASKAMALASQKDKEKPKAFELDAALKDRVNRPRKHAASAVDDQSAAPDKQDASSSGDTNKPQGKHSSAPGGFQGTSTPLWQPLGFGPALSAEQFAAWQQAIRAGIHPQAKSQFEEWQQRMRSAAPAAPPPPSKESFQEWQKMLREGKKATGDSPPTRDRKRKRDKKEKRDRKQRTPVALATGGPDTACRVPE